MWFTFALASSIFAALTSILAKIGIEGVNSTLATAVRTFVVLVMSWGMVFITNTQGGLWEISRRSWIFLILSGIATWYAPEDLIGKKVVFVANLAPRNMAGELSEGMIVAGDCPNGDVKVMFVDDAVPAGASIH